ARARRGRGRGREPVGAARSPMRQQAPSKRRRRSSRRSRSFGEELLVQLRRGNREVLPQAGQIDEAKVDDLRSSLFGELDRVFGRHVGLLTTREFGRDSLSTAKGLIGVAK